MIDYPESFIHPDAVVEGMVEMAIGSSVWAGAVLRGDMNTISIGRAVNIQDNSTLHTDSSHSIRIGEFSLVGHNAMIHGAQIGKACLIGIGCIVLDDAEIGDGAMITAGCLIRGGLKIPKKAMVVQKNGALKVYPDKSRYLHTIAGSIEYMQLVARYKEKRFEKFTSDEESNMFDQAKLVANEIGLD